MRIEYKEGYKYQLTKDVALQTDIYPPYDIHTPLIDLTKKGKLTMRRFYAWDGPSGCCPDWKWFMPASLPHDALYQLMRMGLLDLKWRERADNVMRLVLIEDGTWEWVAKGIYYALRVGAEYAASPENRKVVMTAP